MFILSSQRNVDVEGAFDRYRKYLELNRDNFPRSAYELATSDWYFDPRRSKCPHDGWLEKISITEPATGEHSEIREVEIVVDLLGAWHDGNIRFRYHNVQKYLLDGVSMKRGHGDWLYDEFTVSSTGTLIHEIEWVNGRWLIEAADVDFSWHPFDDERRRTDLLDLA